MKTKRFYILAQRYPDHLGRKPLSFAIYLQRRFWPDLLLGYAWSLSRAYVALQFIKQSTRKAQEIK